VRQCYLIAVLRAYADQPEKYRIDDDVTSGVILTRDAYSLSLPKGTGERQSFAQLRYDKRRLADGGQALLVWPPDFEHLPTRDRAHWESFVIQSPEFQEHDPEFEMALRQNFGGEFVDAGDPIVALRESIEDVNRSVPLFRRSENPELTYPFLNNQKDYSASHRELYKLIGPDNIDQREVKQILTSLGIAFDPSAKTMALFRQLARSLLGQTAGKVLSEALNDHLKARAFTTHDVTNWQPTAADYIDKFREECGLVAQAIAALGLALRRAQTREMNNA
jgi:hypothetical protein